MLHATQRYLPALGLEDYLTQLGIPGISIAVIEDGKIDWAAGYGVREAGLAAPVTPDTMFLAGSISKPVAAFAALIMVQRGWLELDCDVNAYLTSWQVPANGSWQPRITLRQLFSHSAGTTVEGFRGYRRHEPVPTVPQVLDGAPPANSPPVRVERLPGMRSTYSGGGVTIAQQVMTDAARTPFPDLVRELVFEPLGMDHSTYEQPLPEERWPAAAAGHRAWNTPVDGSWYVYPEMAAAGLWTTPSDLARLAIDLQRAYAGEPDTVLSAAAAHDMLRPQVEEEIGSGAYGLGFLLQERAGAAQFVHDGLDAGFYGSFVSFRDTGQGVIVMTNSDIVSPIHNDLRLTVARAYGWQGYEVSTREVIDPRKLEAYAGEYRLPNVHTLRIACDGSVPALYAPGQDPIELQPLSTTEWVAETIDLEVAFLRDEAGAVTGMELRQSDGVVTASRESSGHPSKKI